MNTLPRLECGLETPAQRNIHIGRGTALFLRGWTFCAASDVKTLHVFDGHRHHPVLSHSWARIDVFRHHFPHADPDGRSLCSHFQAIVPIEAIGTQETRVFSLRAVLKNGQVVEAELGSFELFPGFDRKPIDVVWSGKGAKVAICMATYNPPFDLFRRQIESIVAQEHTNWVCIITDDSPDARTRAAIREIVGSDDRFRYIPNAKRNGFYKNFEACMSHIPIDADFVALSDQDDYWYPEKLSVLIGQIGGKSLIFSDCRIVSSDGLVSDTYWVGRRNHCDDLLSLFIANTVTGAASLFRRDVLEYVLPLPQNISDAYHDHWLALVSSAMGGIGYVDRPLYDYSQHGGNIIGHANCRYGGIRATMWDLMRNAKRKEDFKAAGRRALAVVSEDFAHAIQKTLFAVQLRLRVPLRVDDEQIVDRMSRYGIGLMEPVRMKLSASGRSTLNVEGVLLRGALGVRARNIYYRLRKSAFITPPPPAMLSGRPEAPPPAVTSPTTIANVEDTAVKWIFHSVAPLNLDIANSEPKRVNLLLATIDFRYIFGGYLGMFSLALRLSAEGFNVRIILLEPTDVEMNVWRNAIKKYPGVDTLFDEVEVIQRYDRAEEVRVSPQDRFVATNGWGAHVAHKASQELKQDRFMFMVQEYEPYFLPMNTISALFQQSYEFPQFDLFSTPHLRDFFKQNRIGLFAHPNSDDNHAVFKNAIQKFSPSLSDMQRPERRILFYARPEEHAARNLFELGMKALAELARSPGFDAETWKFYGMGSIGGVPKIRLAPNVLMELLPKTDLQTYAERMPLHDVGLSLMLTPHPSLVPLEMASAGMWTVTNTFANKTAESLEAVSSNIIAVEPTLESVIEGLRRAISRVEQYDERLAGADVNWPSSWDDAFPPEDMAKVLKFLADG